MNRQEDAVVGVPAPCAHGGDGDAIARALGLDPASILDLSASLNPFAPDLRPMLTALVDRGELSHYPDDSDARNALASAMGVTPELLILTNGGAEAIALVAAQLGRGYARDPEFSLFHRHLSMIDRNGPRFASNPNNPTGLLAAIDETAAVWDEAFYPLATGKWTRGDAGGETVVVGSLTKLFACPGLRIGYIICPDERFAAAVNLRRPAWSLNGLAAKALPGMLAMADLPAWSLAIARARDEMVSVLKAHGLAPRQADANWVLVDQAGDLRRRLAPLGVIVRGCESFQMPDTVRIAVPGAFELERLDSVLGAISQ